MLLKGSSGVNSSWAQMKEDENPKEWAITGLYAPIGSSDIEIQSHKHESRHFPDFKPRSVTS